MSAQYIDRNTLFLLRGETLADASWYKRQITNNGVAASAEQSRFGGKSLKFDGNSVLLLDSFDFGSGDFTIDWWEYAETGAQTRFSSYYPSDYSYGGLMLGYSGKGTYWSTEVSNWDIMNQQMLFDLTPGEWVHWAFVRSETMVRTFRNGVKFASIAIPADTTVYTNPAVKMAIGGYRQTSMAPWKGYIDEFRISRVARWTRNFTPPDRQYAFTLITDRTSDDVDRVNILAAKAWQDMTAEERAEWLSPLKGTYNYTDLNRVEEAVAYVAGRLREFGYLPDQPVIRYWSGEDIPNENDLSRYLRNVATLRGAIAVWASTPGAPNSTNGFGINEANALEQILVDVDQILTRISNTWFFLGDLFAAEV